MVHFMKQLLLGFDFRNLTSKGFEMIVESEDPFLLKIELVFDLVKDRKFFSLKP